MAAAHQSLRDDNRLTAFTAAGMYGSAAFVNFLEDLVPGGPALLTGLLNRRGFDERATVELAHARREHTYIAIACFDIDLFKRINDEWGHETGDRVLEYLGAVLAAGAREIDAVARVGGEEFVVLLPGATVADAVGFTDRIHETIAVPHEGLPAIRVSAGVAAASAPDGIEALLHQADIALYAAKSGGRNRTNVFTEIALSA